MIKSINYMKHKFITLLFLSVVCNNLSANSEAYRLGAGDRIYIQVFDESDLTMETRISANGIINYSFLGQLQVSGRTSAELEDKITQQLRNGYLVNPSVNVSIIEYRAFFINGEISNPGDYPYQPGLTLEKAVTLAGGLTDHASKRKMYLQKQNNNSEERIRVHMDHRIEPGDIITIEEGFF